MTLAELYAQLVPSFPQHARKDLKTAVRVLARALECPDPEHCMPDHYNQPLPSLYQRVEQLLLPEGKKAHTIRNLKNHISRLFRLAKEQHLFALVPPQIVPRYDDNHKPLRSGAQYAKMRKTSLVFREWPPTLQADFLAFQTWATAPLVPDRPAHLRKRQTTVDHYRASFEGYFGYLSHMAHLIPTFDHLFEIALVKHYVSWHVNDCHHKPTIIIRYFLDHLRALATQYRPLPDFVAEIAAFKKTIPEPDPVLNKEDAWVSLATLREIASAIWPRKKKPTDYSPRKRSRGLQRSVQAGYSLMLKLWTYIPYRQRNMREMKLRENLHKDAQGAWRITFRGEQLKVASKQGRINVFDMPFPPTLVPVLEDYLTIWRPVLLAASPHPDQEQHVFLTMKGKPHQRTNLTTTTRNMVYRYTGKLWHPHIIRTVWATEWIRNGGDFYKAALMLNDTLKVVIANYAHLRDENVAEEVYEALDKKRNGQGK